MLPILLLIPIAGCGTVAHSQLDAGKVCPPVKAYSATEQTRVADELAKIPGSETGQWIADYIDLRDVLRACGLAAK